MVKDKPATSNIGMILASMAKRTTAGRKYNINERLQHSTRKPKAAGSADTWSILTAGTILDGTKPSGK